MNDQTIFLPQPTGERMTGLEIGQELLRSSDRFQRELTIEKLIDEGQIPQFMSNVAKIESPVPENDRAISFFVLPEVLCLGTDDDFVRVPLFPTTAQRIADKLGFILPTTKMSDLVWKNADVRVEPQPWGPPYDESMMSSYRIVEHNRRCNISVKKARPDSVPGMLISGHKKDVVVCHEMKQDHEHVWIYGWHRLDGKPIQGLYGQHEKRYCDYSHSIRFVLRSGILRNSDGSESTIDLIDVLSDPKLFKSICRPSPLTSWRYPID